MQPRPEPAERLTYGSVVEGMLLHGLGGRVRAPLAERLRRIGVDVERPLLPAYPLQVWLHCLWAIVEEVYPGVPAEQAFRDLGVRMVEGYGKTVLGRAVLVLSRMVGPRRTVYRLPSMFASADNWSRTEVMEKGPCHFEIRHNSNTDTPGYFESIIETVLRQAGARDAEVWVLEQDANSTLYELRWGEALKRAPG